MSRVTHNVNELNKHQVLSKCDTIITFRNQQLLDLWINEMSGQISDGMWENSRGTEWLWKSTWVQLGNETRVECRFSYCPGGMKKSYPLTKELWDVVGDRILDENGFSDKKEAYAAWREIYEAIRNVSSFRPETKTSLEAVAQTVEAQRKKTAAAMTQEWLDAGFKIKEEKYGWSDRVYRSFEWLYIDEDTKKNFVTVETGISEDGTNGWWKLCVGGSTSGHKYTIPAGHLAEGWKKIQSFYQDFFGWKLELKNQK